MNHNLNFKYILEGIKPLDQEAMRKAQERTDSLIKPLGSLGKLENIGVRLAGITGQVKNRADKCATIVMAADNGICDEGVSCSPQEITLIQAVNMTRGITGMGVLSAHANSKLLVVDIGIKNDFDNEKVINKKIMYGTNNFAKGPAMERSQAEAAIEVGMEIVKELKADGFTLLGTGEMGIGNTSSSSAVAMILTGASSDQAVGKGGGLTEEAYINKKRILKEAIALNKPDRDDPVDTISKVGGLDIAGLVGCYIGAAYYRLPIVVDGVISAAAALAAVRLNPLIKDYIFASHKSEEPTYNIIAEELELLPMLDMNMRLGEGTGCALAFPIISAACAVMNNMATFDEINFDEKYRVDIR